MPERKALLAVGLVVELALARALLALLLSDELVAIRPQQTSVYRSRSARPRPNQLNPEGLMISSSTWAPAF